MAEPNKVTCPQNTWTKIATAVVSGQIWRLRSGPSYLMTYRLTGNPAPSDTSDAVRVFLQDDLLPISAIDDIDVYLYPRGGNGEVRVDV